LGQAPLQEEASRVPCEFLETFGRREEKRSKREKAGTGVGGEERSSP